MHCVSNKMKCVLPERHSKLLLVKEYKCTIDGKVLNKLSVDLKSRFDFQTIMSV